MTLKEYIQGYKKTSEGFFWLWFWIILFSPALVVFGSALIAGVIVGKERLT